MSEELSRSRGTWHRVTAFLILMLAIPVGTLLGVLAPLACVLGVAVAFAWIAVRSVGWSFAATSSLLGAGVVSYFVAVATYGSSLPLGSALALTMLVVTAAGSWLRGSGRGLRRIGRGFEALAAQPLPRLKTVAPVVAVPLWWIVVAVAAAWVPGASTHDWALSGDSANNVLFSKDIVTANGLRLVSENPVPLPHLMVALGMPSGAAPTVDDVSAYVWVWHVGIAATAGLAGLMGHRMARAVSLGAVPTWVSAFVPGVLVVSWAITGYASAFGFINVHVALAVVFASIALAVGTVNASLAISGQVCAAILLVLTWSPLAVVPVALAIAPAITMLKGRSTARERLVAIGAALVGVIFLVARYWSSTQGLSDAVSSQAGVVAPSQRSAIAVLVCVAVLVALWWRRDRALALVVGTAGTALAAALASLTVLVGAWTYYPMKMAWFFVAIVVIVGAAAAPRALSRVVARRAWLPPAIVAALAVTFTVAIPSSGEVKDRAEWVHDPAASILFPRGDGDQVFGALIDMDRSDTSLLWKSSVAVEREADFWAASLRSGVFHPVDGADARFGLRALAYAQMSPDDSYVCEFARRWGGPLVVLTDDGEFADQMALSCDADHLTVVREHR